MVHRNAATMLQTIASPVRGFQLYFIVLLLVISMQTCVAQDEVAESEKGSCLMQSVPAGTVARGARKLEKLDEATGSELPFSISQSHKAIKQLDSASEPIVQQQSENTSKTSQERLHTNPLAAEPTLANLTTIEKTNVSSHSGGFSTDSLITVNESVERQTTKGMRNFEAELQNRMNQTSGRLISYVGRALHFLTGPDQKEQFFVIIAAIILIFCVISVLVLATQYNDFEDNHEGIGGSKANDALVADMSRSPVLPVQMPLQMPPVSFTPRASEAKSLPGSIVRIGQPGLNQQAPLAPRESHEPSPFGGAFLVDQSPSSQSAGVKYLCPELVVPQEGECCLLMPKVPLHTLQALRPRSATIPPIAGTDSQISITDMKGAPVLQAIFQFPDPTSHPNLDKPQKGRILLCSPGEDKRAFGHLTEAQSMASNDGSVLTLHDDKGLLFGSLRAEVGDRGSGYAYSACNGSRLYFSGDFNYDSVQGSSIQAQGLIFDEQKELQAFVKPRVLDQSSRSVRVGPLVDVGCILLCLLGIDMLEL